MKLGKMFLLSVLSSFLVAFFLMISAKDVFCTQYTINFTTYYFSPSSLNVSVGDTIVWSGTFSGHQIQSTSVPGGASTFGPSSGSATTFVYIITTAGTYDYQCNYHYSMGMTGSFTASASSSSTTRALTLSTTSLNFGSLRAGQTKNLTMSVNSTGPDAALTISSSPLSIGTMYTNSPTSTNRSVSVGSSETESVTFQPSARGLFYDTLTINSDATTASDQVKKIFLSGTGINGAFTGATTMAFGQLRVGTTTQLTYTITNSGEDTLFLSAASVTGSGFSLVSGAAQNILPSATGTVTVKFSPLARQAYTGTLTMTAQNNVSVPSITISGTGIAPVISLTPASTYDMGVTSVGGILPGDILVTNTGDDVLHVTGVSIPTTQQGAKFTLTSPTSFTLNPAGSTDIAFTYTSSAESIDQATLTLSDDDPVTSSKQISLSARSGVPKMSLDTKDTIDFGSVRLNTPANAFLTITNTGTYDLTVQIGSFSPSVFSLSSIPSTIPPQGNAQAAFIFTPTVEGPVTGSAIVHSSDTKNGTDTIYFKGAGINTALDFPASVDFHQLNTGKTRDTVLTLKNFGTAGANILRYSITDPNSGFLFVDSAAHKIASNDSVTIKVRFAPTKEISYAGTVNILTDDGALPIRTITLAGTGINSKLTTSLSSIDFGTIDSGNTSSKTFTITNTGTAATTITSITSSGDPSFILGQQKTPIQLSAGASNDVSVTFAPKAAGTFDGNVSISASEGSPLSVSLHGKGHVTIIITSVSDVNHDLGLKMMLYPNPNNGSATIKLSLDKPLLVKLALYDATGKLVQDYKQAAMNAGESALNLSGESLPSGEYYLRAISANNTVAEAKVLIVR